MSEASCQNCNAACCKGVPLLTMELTAGELAFMQEGGNQFMTVAGPTDHDREKVIYPAGVQINQNRGTFNWLVEKGKKYKLLAAGYGRYALLGDCNYIATTGDNREQCSVYEQRPKVCRDLRVDSIKCLHLRIKNGARLT